MSDRLLDQPADGLTARAGSGATIHDGELAVITVANRPSGDALDTLTIVGGATRVLCLAAGGRALDDRVVAADDPAHGIVELPRATERVALVGIGASASVAGPVPGWYAGQSLPSIGWGAALAGGAVVLAQGSRVRDNRDRGDGGWLSGHELVTAARVVTTFTDPVSVVAVVIDDYLGSDAAAQVSMRLLDAARELDAAGDPVAAAGARRRRALDPAVRGEDHRPGARRARRRLRPGSSGRGARQRRRNRGAGRTAGRHRRGGRRRPAVGRWSRPAPGDDRSRGRPGAEVRRAAGAGAARSSRPPPRRPRRRRRQPPRRRRPPRPRRPLRRRRLRPRRPLRRRRLRPRRPPRPRKPPQPRRPRRRRRAHDDSRLLRALPSCPPGAAGGWIHRDEQPGPGGRDPA